jgi:hypothetical protein
LDLAAYQRIVDRYLGRIGRVRLYPWSTVVIENSLRTDGGARGWMGYAEPARASSVAYLPASRNPANTELLTATTLVTINPCVAAFSAIS